MSALRVGIDATVWPNRRGYGRFARNVISRLVELDEGTTYVLYIDEESAATVELPAEAEIRRVPLRRAPSRAAAADGYRSPLDLMRLARAVRRDRLDAFLFTSVYTYFPVVGVPAVIGVHDAIAEEFPKLTLPTVRARLFWRAKQRMALLNATRLFTVSEASRSVLSERLGVPPDRLTVVPEAPDPCFSPKGPEEVAAALTTIGMQPGEPFLLFAGGISPHKNLETLLEAYALLRRARHQLPLLVAVGALDDDPYLSAAGTVRARIRHLGLEGCVRLPGFVSDEVLACLYSSATAVVIPSLAEGFGLPAVEAAACGGPTVLSDLPAHRETLGNAALYFPPTDAASLAGVLGQVLDDPALQRSLAERGRAAVSRLSWDLAAETLRSLLREAARRDGG